MRQTKLVAKGCVDALRRPLRPRMGIVYDICSHCRGLEVSPTVIFFISTTSRELLVRMYGRAVERFRQWLWVSMHMSSMPARTPEIK